MYDIITSVVIGAAAGLVTVVITGLWGWHSQYRNRREQTAHIRNLVTDGMEPILSAKALPPLPGQSNPIPADSIRYAHFRTLQDHLRVAVLYRGTHLTYQEIASLQKVLANIESMCTALGMHANKSMPLEVVDAFDADLQKLEWLGLPTHSTKEDSSMKITEHYQRWIGLLVGIIAAVVGLLALNTIQKSTKLAAAQTVMDTYYAAKNRIVASKFRDVDTQKDLVLFHLQTQDYRHGSSKDPEIVKLVDQIMMEIETFGNRVHTDVLKDYNEIVESICEQYAKGLFGGLAESFVKETVLRDARRQNNEVYNNMVEIEPIDLDGCQ